MVCTGCDSKHDSKDCQKAKATRQNLRKMRCPHRQNGQSGCSQPTCDGDKFFVEDCPKKK